MNLYKNFKDYFSFETYIKSDKINNSTFTTKNKDRILGALPLVVKWRLN